MRASECCCEVSVGKEFMKSRLGSKLPDRSSGGYVEDGSSERLKSKFSRSLMGGTAGASSALSSFSKAGKFAIAKRMSVYRQSSKLSPVLSKAMSRHSGNVRKHGARLYIDVII